MANESVTLTEGQATDRLVPTGIQSVPRSPPRRGAEGSFRCLGRYAHLFPGKGGNLGRFSGDNQAREGFDAELTHHRREGVEEAASLTCGRPPASVCPRVEPTSVRVGDQSDPY